MGDQFGITFGVQAESKIGPFSGQPPDGHLEATWKVSLLAWGSLWRPGVPDSLQKQYKTVIFKIVSFRYHGSLGWLLDAMLPHFGEVLDPKMEPQKH